jgi:hypothetical protein
LCRAFHNYKTDCAANVPAKAMLFYGRNGPKAASDISVPPTDVRKRAV